MLPGAHPSFSHLCGVQEQYVLCC